jgi:hypothetical protein
MIPLSKHMSELMEDVVCEARRRLDRPPLAQLDGVLREPFGVSDGIRVARLAAAVGIQADVHDLACAVRDSTSELAQRIRERQPRRPFVNEAIVEEERTRA